MDEINLAAHDLSPLCSLCGGSIGRPYNRTADSLNAEREWCWAARGICGNKQFYDPSIAPLTEPCILSGRRLVPAVIANTDPEAQLRPRQYELSIRGRSTATYGVHEICWKLLLERIEILCETTVVPENVARWLFWLLAALPYSPRGGLITRDGYHGASNQRKRSTGKLEIFPAYPKRGLTWDELRSAGFVRPSLISIEWSETCQDPLSRLPYEIICSITSLLSPVDVCRSRLASRWLAIHAAPTKLPPAFWADRFAHDGELGFLGIKRIPKDPEDSYALYLHHKSLLADDMAADGLRNRRRIWSCLDPFARTLARLHRLDDDCMMPTHELPPQSSELSLGQGISCYRFTSTDGIMQFGASYHRRFGGVLALDNTTDGITLEVSSLCFENRDYISGIEVSSPRWREKVGIMRSADTKTLYIPPNDEILGVDVYMSLDGIRGLVFRLKSPNGRTYTQSAGNLTSQGDHVGVASLEVAGVLRGVMVHVDRFKTLSFQLLDDRALHHSWTYVRLWAVDHRPPEHVLRSLRLPQVNEEMPLHYHVCFGGEDGSRISLLERLAVYMDGAAGFYGLALFYTDGSEVLYGSKTTTHQLGQKVPCIEQSFLIDGPGGERITKLEYSTAKSEHIGRRCVVSLQVTTQFNRQHIFRGYDRKGPQQLQRVVVNIPDDHYSISVVLELAAPLWCLNSIYSATSCPLPAGDIHILPLLCNREITEENTDCAPWMTRKTGALFATAPLSSLRRVRISSGSKNIDTDMKHITGLWFEYFDRKSDGVVGQWMKEIGSFTLEISERIIGVDVVGIENVRNPNPSVWHAGRVVWKGIRVVSLHFKTSMERVYHFEGNLGHSVAKRKRRLVYRATPYEELGTILWGSNFEADDIQIMLKASDLLGSGHLLFCEATCRPHHPDLESHKTRSFFSYDGTEPEPLNPLHKVGAYGAVKRYYYAHRAFFWTERGHDDVDKVCLVKIDLVYDKTTSGVRGVRCTYEGGIVKEFGLMDGVVSTLDLSQHSNEKVSHLVARHININDHGIELHTTRGQVCRVMPDGKEDYEVDSYAMIRGVNPPRVSGEMQWRKTHWSFPDTNPTGQPVSRCVGFWVSGRDVAPDDEDASQRGVPYMDACGPIYMTSSGNKSLLPSLGLGLKERIHHATHGGGWIFK